MIPQSFSNPAFDPSRAQQLHIEGESCPSCGLDIPPERLEEVKGKIAARTREQALAITHQLEMKYAAEKLQADAKSKADLELERQQSAAREEHVREEARKAAETLIEQKRLESERTQEDLVTTFQEKIVAAESARQSAEQIGANLQNELRELREASAAAVAAVKAEAKEREAEIRHEAKKTAESAVSDRLAAIETAHKESEASLQARINEAETTKIAAEERGATLALQLDELRRANIAEVAKLKEDAFADALRIRRGATEEAETRLRDTLATQEKAVAEANTRACEAENKVLALTEQHASTLEANLNAQREVLEKAKEDAINGEKAKAFEENQKLVTRVNDLQRALEKKSAEELGEGAEIDLFEALKKEFPDDGISRIAKGTPGADVRHVVMRNGKECGTILYDSKNHNQFRWDHVDKLKNDQLAAKAEHAILSTHKFPQGTRQLHIHEGIILANPARVVGIATLIRQHLLQIHTMRLSEVEREKKTGALYEFITSERYTRLLARVDERASELLELQAKEKKWHDNHWKNQGEACRSIQKAKADIENEVSSIIGIGADDAVSEGW